MRGFRCFKPDIAEEEGKSECQMGERQEKTQKKLKNERGVLLKNDKLKTEEARTLQK